MLTRLKSLWRNLRDNTRVERELDDEMRSYVDLLTAEKLRTGLSETEAHRAALIETEGVEQVKEQVRDARAGAFVESMLRDLRYALRQMRRSPGFTAVAIITLALGIGANAAIFSLFDAALLQTLPIPHPEQLVSIRIETPQGGWMTNVPSELFDELRHSPQSFSGIFAFWSGTENVRVSGETYRTSVQTVSGDFYPTLGVSAELGRLLTPADDTNAATNPVAVISHSFWVRHFGASATVIGRPIYVQRRGGDSIPVTIVGVTPLSFFGVDRGSNPDVTMPLGNPQLTNLWVMGRLKPGVSERQARTEVDYALQRAFERIRPRLARSPASERERILSNRGGIVSGSRGGGMQELLSYRQELSLLIVLSSLVLLIACANIANLLMARSAARSVEMGVRLAIGASRGRLIRQLITESGLLALFGGVLGAGLAFEAQHVLATLLLRESVAQGLTLTLNPHVLGYTALVVILTLLLFGVAPAFRATRVEVSASLKPAVRSDARLRFGTMKTVIIAQVAASLLLLVGAGLASRSLYNLRHVDAGFDSENLLTIRVDATPTHYSGPASANFYRELSSRIQALPVVSSASLAANYVFGNGNWNKTFRVEGHSSEESRAASFNVVAPGFFETTGTPVLLGREFSEHDSPGSPDVVVVNEAFARAFLSDRNPVGSHLSDGRANYEVIGVVKDAKYGTLRERATPMIYHALWQEDRASAVTLHVRARGNPAPLVARIREEIRTLHGSLPVYNVRTLKEQVDQTLQRDRMMAALSSFFGLLALLLTSVGLYGVIAYAVARRTKEVGVRIALGARRGGLLWMVLRETLVVVVAGAILGLPVAYVSVGLLRKLLFGLQPQDPLTMMGAVFVLLLVGGLAGYLPARRAAGADPLAALRCE